MKFAFSAFAEKLKGSWLLLKGCVTEPLLRNKDFLTMQKMKTGLFPDVALGLFCCPSSPNFTSNEGLLFGAVPRRI